MSKEEKQRLERLEKSKQDLVKKPAVKRTAQEEKTLKGLEKAIKDISKPKR